MELTWRREKLQRKEGEASCPENHQATPPRRKRGNEGEKQRTRKTEENGEEVTKEQRRETVSEFSKIKIKSQRKNGAINTN